MTHIVGAGPHDEQALPEPDALGVEVHGPLGELVLRGHVGDAGPRGEDEGPRVVAGQRVEVVHGQQRAPRVLRVQARRELRARALRHAHRADPLQLPCGGEILFFRPNPAFFRRSIHIRH